MVISKSTFIFWLLAILAIGIACGYLFSSKFCSVTIGKRVEKISTLNQSLRKLFALRAFYRFGYDHAQSADQENISARVATINDEISTLIAAYYDKQAGATINEWLNGKISLEKFTSVLSQLNPAWATSISTIKDTLAKSQEMRTKTQEALSHNDWQRAFDLFEQNLNRELEFADELDKGIMQQFPHKF